MDFVIDWTAARDRAQTGRRGGRPPRGRRRRATAGEGQVVYVAFRLG